MKLLFDENLSGKLVARLAELYPDSLHVAEAGLLESPDSEIWEFAKAGGFVIVTADCDFYGLATTIGPPPQPADMVLFRETTPLRSWLASVWLRGWTHPTRDGERVLRREAIRIMEFAADPELAVLVLDRD